MSSVDDVSELMDKVHDGVERFKRGGVRKIWVYGALDDGQEVMILQEIEDEISARQWIDHPDAAAEWMSNAGLGAYPTQFVGRFAHLMSIGSRAERPTMFVCLCTGVTSHVVNEVVAKGANDLEAGRRGVRRRWRLRTVPPHPAGDDRGSLRGQWLCVGNRQPLVQRLADSFDAAARKGEIAGEWSLVAQPGLQPRDRDAELDRREHFVVSTRWARRPPECSGTRSVRAAQPNVG